MHANHCCNEVRAGITVQLVMAGCSLSVTDCAESQQGLRQE